MADAILSETAVYSGFLISVYSSAVHRSISEEPVRSGERGNSADSRQFFLARSEQSQNTGNLNFLNF